MKVDLIKTDFLVVGSGIAGLNFALEAAKFGRVTVVTKKDILTSNTNLAQGGIAAVLDPLDSPANHIKDTLDAGSNINDKKAVAVMVKEGPVLVKKLNQLGVKFQLAKGNLALTKEGGHSCRRIAYSGDRTGAEIERVLVKKIRASKNVKVLEHTFVCDLIERKGEVQGCLTLDQSSGDTKVILARATVLASGGAGQVYYPHTTNPPIATGDGVAMGLRSGALARDMEFFQFHPTALFKKGCPVFLLSESLRGEGAYLVNAQGKRFMKKYDARGELATRDIVARAIVDEEKKGPVFLDIRHFSKQKLMGHFPTITAKLNEYGMDPLTEVIPISPAVHYMIGGLKVDLFGSTGIKRFYAFGEVACTGVHGANRLASNSLLEALVFSHHVAGKLPLLKKLPLPQLKIKDVELPETMVCRRAEVTAIRDKLTSTMWRAAGIVRTKTQMQAGLKIVKKLQAELDQFTCHHTFYYETRNMVMVGLEILKAALKRKKSIGTHYVLN